MEFHAIRLCVTNFQDCLRFYRDILGFEEWHDDEQQYAYFEKANIALFSQEKMAEALFQEYQLDETTSQMKFVIQLEVPDVDIYYNNLKDKSVGFINKPHDRKDWGSRVAHFYDPEKNIIEIYKGK
ncbi:VOC family protein [Priestia megaterium]|uniref:VOC family protein n=1 Tax=Priestia megaterium TaxID=1404 RepID=UPI002A69C914|nr:VOC family protein [Priestia megaterium]MDY0943297.1 VOC family protein [Priestia megaterium]